MALGVRAECRRGCIPSDLATGTAAEIEEERRLLYVAVTRARDELHLLMPQRFFTHGQRAYGDRHVFAARSRFIPEALLVSAKVETAGGVFQVREDELAPRVGSGLHRTP